MEEIPQPPAPEQPAAEPPAADPPGSDRPGSDRPLLSDVRAWARDLIVSLFIAGIFIVFLYQPVKVEGTSMMPQLLDQERIFINKFVYKFDSIERWDVIVFWYPLDPSKSYVKRVIGLPGESVKVTGGKVLVDGKALDEQYVLPEYLDHQSYPTVRVEPDHYYVMGDHRNSSNDSRAWGTVGRSYIYGKAVLVYWPVDKFGRVQ